jgi:diguanylate cyclase (GGDEF)-like protein
MRTERINVRKLLGDVLGPKISDTGLRREAARALAEPDTLVAWEKALSIMQALCKSGGLKWLGAVEKDGGRYLRFTEAGGGDIYSLREPPTARTEVIPFLPRGFVKREDAGKIEALFTSVATCRSEDELGNVLKGMLETIREMVTADFAAVYITDETLRGVIESVSAGSPAASQRFAPSVTDRWVVSEGFCVHVANLKQRGGLRRYSGKEGFASVVVLPLSSGDRTYGVLEVWSRNEGHFSSDDLGFLSLLAMLAASMIRNAEHLESLIFRDPLTHVYNRGFLEDQLQRELERYRRTNEPVSFLMVDVDNFKQVNTDFGHPVGDVVLSTLAHLLEGKVRQIDVVARYGGDEFGIILPDTIGEHAAVTAERLRRVVEDYDFSITYAPLADVRMTISIGGAICPDDGVSKDDLIDKADQALAKAEREGKNRTVFFSLPPAEGKS